MKFKLNTIHSVNSELIFAQKVAMYGGAASSVPLGAGTFFAKGGKKGSMSYGGKGGKSKGGAPKGKGKGKAKNRSDPCTCYVKEKNHKEHVWELDFVF